MLETLDYTIRIGSIPTFLYFDFNQIWMATVTKKCLLSQHFDEISHYEHIIGLLLRLL